MIFSATGKSVKTLFPVFNLRSILTTLNPNLIDLFGRGGEYNKVNKVLGRVGQPVVTKVWGVLDTVFFSFYFDLQRDEIETS